MKNNELEKHLFYETRNIYESPMEEPFMEKIHAFSEKYKKMITEAKTERIFSEMSLNMAKEKSFKPLESLEKIREGEKIVWIYGEKCVCLAVKGKKPWSEGFKGIAAHIDSPRLDLKIRPLQEESEMALFKSQYYGGIKKYQWTTIPLALMGTTYTSTGKRVDVNIGNREDEPVFLVNDLLIHLSKDQMEKKLREGVEGEKLSVIAGTAPFTGEKIKENKIKYNVLRKIFETYGLKEEELIGADLSLVPASPARDSGFDRSLIAAYGQDDRVCAYPALEAILEQKAPNENIVLFLFDREEIGSYGNTGADSNIVEQFLVELMDRSGEDTRMVDMVRSLRRSRFLSADVSPALDPNYSDVMDASNAPFLNRGIVLTKFSGSRGKAGGNETGAEFFNEITRQFNKDGIIWQPAEMGKVDQGGGGTVAVYLARYGSQVLDCGPAILSMHAPLEISSKADLYMTYMAFSKFYQAD